MNVHSVNYGVLFSTTSNSSWWISHMREDEFPECRTPANGFPAAKYFHDAKLCQRCDFIGLNSLAGRFALTPKNKEKQIISFTEVGESGDQWQSPAVFLESGTHGQDHVRPRVGEHVLQQIKKALVIFVVGHPANGEASPVDKEAPERFAAGQYGESVRFAPSPGADQHKCFTLFQRSAPPPQ